MTDAEDRDASVDPAERARLRALLAAVTDEDRVRVEPPASLWDRIATAVEAAEAPAGPAPLTGPSVGAPVPSPSDVVADGAAPVAPVASLDAARRRRHRAIGLAVAAAVVLLAATGLLLTRSTDHATTEPALVAATTLDPLEPVGEAGAEARLLEADGHFQLVLDTHDMAAAPEGQHYELWLLDPASDSAAPVSLGPMTGSTTVAVPDGVDPAAYDVVDISLQDAGQTEHSGHSLLRGTLA